MSLRATSGESGGEDYYETNAFIEPAPRPRSKMRKTLMSLVDSIESLWDSLHEAPKKMKRSIHRFKHSQHLLYATLIISLLVFVLQGSFRQKMVSTNESLGLINIPDKEWGERKSLYANMERHKHNKELFIDEPNVWYQYNYPVEFICPNAQRIGMSHDSTGVTSTADYDHYLGDGKWICNPNGIVDIVMKRLKRTSLQWLGERVGYKYKGKNGCLIYSIGVNSNHLGFESSIQRILTQEAMKKGYKKGKPFCEIHVFDPAGYHEQLLIEDGIEYHNFGIVASSKSINGKSDEAEDNLLYFKSFQEVVMELGHEGHVIDVMKVDCKMCEWGIYDDWFARDDPNSSLGGDYIGLKMIQQLLVEVHGTPEEYVNDFFERMRDEEYVIFHKDSDTENFQGMSQDYAFLKLDRDFFPVDG